MLYWWSARMQQLHHVSGICGLIDRPEGTTNCQQGNVWQTNFFQSNRIHAIHQASTTLQYFMLMSSMPALSSPMAANGTKTTGCWSQIAAQSMVATQNSQKRRLFRKKSVWRGGRFVWILSRFYPFLLRYPTKKSQKNGFYKGICMLRRTCRLDFACFC